MEDKEFRLFGFRLAWVSKLSVIPNSCGYLYATTVSGERYPLASLQPEEVR